MCGIVGAVAERNVLPILIEGLRRLEYRGYDSAGVALLDGNAIDRVRATGKVEQLSKQLEASPHQGHVGIAHTRWATHGAPTEGNAHPHLSRESVAVVHNGIIENYREVREDLRSRGYQFESETDTEVVAHLVHSRLASGDDLLEAVRASVALLHGAYAIGVVSSADPGRIVAARTSVRKTERRWPTPC